ncbi:plasmid pRiA4b ORF-3 family protein [Streptomyces sp. NBC_00483]|uniref:plasmid pRiA4b ORF-3 family protein n=1 Tax=Streptomyces sp. NBC_00483 TaxID=2975756 RepID=UPI002E17FC4D
MVKHGSVSRSTASAPTGTVHRLKITLEGVKPPLWRRVIVPSHLTLGSLHDVIQTAFGWGGSHLHDFREPARRGRRWAPAEYLEDGLTLGLPGEPQDLDEEAWTLAEALSAERNTLRYTYDFGDDWRHTVTVEQIRPAGPDDTGRARCTGGRRAMPYAEDIGGSWVLDIALARYAAGERPHGTRHGRGRQAWTEYDDPTDELLAEWRAHGFDPAAFDAAETDRQLSHMTL